MSAIKAVWPAYQRLKSLCRTIYERHHAPVNGSRIHENA